MSSPRAPPEMVEDGHVHVGDLVAIAILVILVGTAAVGLARAVAAQRRGRER